MIADTGWKEAAAALTDGSEMHKVVYFFFPKQMVAFHCHRLLFLKQAVKFAFFRIRNGA